MWAAYGGARLRRLRSVGGLAWCRCRWIERAQSKKARRRWVIADLAGHLRSRQDEQPQDSRTHKRFLISFELAKQSAWLECSSWSLLQIFFGGNPLNVSPMQGYPGLVAVKEQMNLIFGSGFPEDASNFGSKLGAS
jgi:hypothetical protein